MQPQRVGVAASGKAEAAVYPVTNLLIGQVKA